MDRVWIDSNLIIRIVTNDPHKQTAKAVSFLKKAERGDFSLIMNPLVVAECVWVLTSFYKHSRASVAAALAKVLTNPGLDVLDERDVQNALQLMAQKNVDFADAYLATKAQTEGESVASFDKDFRKLGVKRTTIG